METWRLESMDKDSNSLEGSWHLWSREQRGLLFLLWHCGYWELDSLYWKWHKKPWGNRDRCGKRMHVPQRDKIPTNHRGRTFGGKNWKQQHYLSGWTFPRRGSWACSIRTFCACLCGSWNTPTHSCSWNYPWSLEPNSHQYIIILPTLQIKTTQLIKLNTNLTNQIYLEEERLNEDRWIIW